MLKTGNLTVLFQELVRGALSSQRVESSETTEFYLVKLLEGFARPARGDLLDPPLAIDYLEAFQVPGHQRVGKLRRVADTALFVSGVFFESLEGRLVGADYYAALGRAAYAWLSTESGQHALAERSRSSRGASRNSCGCSRRSATASCSAASRTRCGSTSAGYTPGASARPIC